MFTIADIVYKALTPGKTENLPDSQVSRDAMAAELKHGNESVSLDKASAESAAECKSSDNEKTVASQANDEKSAKIGTNRSLLGPKIDGDASDEICGMCDKSISLCKSKGTACVGVNCGICNTIYCSGCAEFTPTQVSREIDRSDILWSCYQCLPKFEEMKLATPLTSAPDSNDKYEGPGLTQITAEIQSNGVSVMRKFDDLKGEVEHLKAQVSEAVTGLNNMSGNMESQFRQIMNDTIFGDEYPDFDPKISHKQAKRIAAEQNRTPPPTFNTVMKSAVAEQKKEDSDKAIARCNLIIYGIEEPQQEDGEARKEHNQMKIDELFGTLECDNIIPVKMLRVGKFKADKDGNPGKPRPLKVILSSQTEAEIIVKNCKKLRDAPEHLKKYSVSHDLTNEERNTIKSLSIQAKDQSAKSPNMDYKVVGPPWQPTIRSFKKRPLQGASP